MFCFVGSLFLQFLILRDNVQRGCSWKIWNRRSWNTKNGICRRIIPLGNFADCEGLRFMYIYKHGWWSLINTATSESLEKISERNHTFGSLKTIVRFGSHDIWQRRKNRHLPIGQKNTIEVLLKDDD